MAFPPAQAPTTWWLSLASRLSRVALPCLVLQNFLLLRCRLACVVAVIPVQLYARARAVGTVASLDAVAATGGWSLASGLILVSSLLYLFLTMRVEAGAPPLRFSCYKWPVYGAVNVFGSLAIAAYFQGLAAGNPSLAALTPRLVV